MPKRERKIPVQIYLSEDETISSAEAETIWNEKQSAFLRHLILYGFVYDVDYSELREYNAALAKIGTI